jgi:DNA repair protein RadC
LHKVHNHPSGNLNPSDADKRITKKLRDASGLMDIPTLDSIIITREGYYSFADEGLL